VDREDRATSVVGTLQHRLQLESLQRIGGARDLRLELGGERIVGLGRKKFGQAGRVLESVDQLVIGRDPALEGADFFDLLTGSCAIGPECRFALARLEILQPRYLAIQVKESLGVRRRAA
jgi:hypothetical protein